MSAFSHGAPPDPELPIKRQKSIVVHGAVLMATVVAALSPVLLSKCSAAAEPPFVPQATPRVPLETELHIKGLIVPDSKSSSIPADTKVESSVAKSCVVVPQIEESCAVIMNTGETELAILIVTESDFTHPSGLVMST